MEKVFCYENNHALVETTGGTVRGYSYNGLTIFKGIPYAQAQRWHAPEPVIWKGVLDATSYGYVCPLLSTSKPNGELKVPHRYWIMNENCQNLNVWTPALDDHKRAVLVWLHGGGYEAGSAIEQLAYEGENMSREGDVVVVSINHRLNILGYLDLSDFGEEYANSGNAGGDDIIAALQWIHDNIEKFGGDPGNVTVFGQSGGGAKVTTLLQTPAADGLYHKGVNMSGVIGPVLADQKGSGKDIVEAMMKVLRVDDIKKMETIPYELLAAVYNKLKPEFVKAGKYVGGAPHPNAYYVGEPVTNGFREETKDIPLMVGSTFGEFNGFGVENEERFALTEFERHMVVNGVIGDEAEEAIVPLFKKAYPNHVLPDLLTLDMIFRVPEIDYIKARRQISDQTYSYMFDLEQPMNVGTVPWHCSDIPYWFHNTELVPSTQRSGVTERIESEMFNALMAFAKTGNPSHEGIPAWKACTAEDEHTMIFSDSTRTGVNFDHELMEKMMKYMGPAAMANLAKLFGNVQH